MRAIRSESDALIFIFHELSCEYSEPQLNEIGVLDTRNGKKFKDIMKEQEEIKTVELDAPNLLHDEVAQEPQQTKMMWFFNGKTSETKHGATFYLQLRKVVEGIKPESNPNFTCDETPEKVLCLVQLRYPEFTWGLGFEEKTTLTAY